MANPKSLILLDTEFLRTTGAGLTRSSLGPGLPEPNQDTIPVGGQRHKLPAGYRVVKTSVLGGLHHEYRPVKEAA